MTQRKIKLTPTQRVIQSMITENTGASILDSGSAYGRNWERNQGRTFKDEPRVTLNFKYGLDVTVNVYHWLCANLEYNPKIQRSFDGWARRKVNEREPWLRVAESYVEHVEGQGIYGDGEPFTTNTYNHDSLISQVVQYVYWTDDAGAHVLLQIHGGCDVRGGYTRPRAFDVCGEGSADGTEIFSDNRATVYCTAKPSSTPQRTLALDGDSKDEEVCGASWWTDDAYHYYDHEEYDEPDHKSHLEEYDQVKLDEGQDPVEAVKARAQAWESRVIFVDPEGNGYCPFCGSRLAADLY